MGRESRSIMLNRITALSQKMTEGLNYSECYEWYFNNYGKSEAMFNKDRTVIYKQWKTEMEKHIDEDKAEILKKIEADRKLARDLFNPTAALQADKLEAQIKGVLNRQGEVVVNNNTLNINLEKLTKDEIKELLQ